MATKKVVLLVEDNPDDVALTQRAFRRSEVTSKLVVMRDGVEALDYLHGTAEPAEREEHGLPQLVLLDLKLPKASGLEVLKRIRSEASTRHLPVVMLTSSDARSDIQESYAEGANSFIRKPVDFDQFLDVVNHLSLYWLRINVPAL